MTTFESYSCVLCDESFTTVGDTKEHITKEHGEKNTRIIHSKLQKDFQEYFEENIYMLKELFSKNK